MEDEKDIALVKIDQKDLPALKVGESKNLTVAKDVYVFGFPSTAEFNRQSLLEPSFTKGVVSAIKSSQNGDFEIFQTDAKVSQGSSGGPLFDHKGEVMGVVTFQTDILTQLFGDNFAFAVPIELMGDVLSRNSIVNMPGSYGINFQAGLKLLHGRRCKDALLRFEDAARTNVNFQVPQFLNSYIEQCDKMIATGESIDTRVDELRERFKSVSYSMWVVLGLAIGIFGVLVLIMAWLIKRMKKEEKEIQTLEKHIDEYETSQKQ